MIAEQWNTAASSTPLLETAWSILEAANDLRDVVTVETCRRVIDANLRGEFPSKSDVDVVLSFFQ
jgi:hypothetical protein